MDPRIQPYYWMIEELTIENGCFLGGTSGDTPKVSRSCNGRITSASPQYGLYEIFGKIPCKCHRGTSLS